MSTDLEHHKDARAMFRRLGIVVPERDRVKFANPFRRGSNPSCDIHNGRFKDWTTNETYGGIGVYAVRARASRMAMRTKGLVGQAGTVVPVSSKFSAAMSRTTKPQTSSPKPPRSRPWSSSPWTTGSATRKAAEHLRRRN